MTTNNIILEEDGGPDGTGRQFYKPTKLTINRSSQYNQHREPSKWQFSFVGLDGWWTVPRDWNKEERPLDNGVEVDVVLSARGNYKDMTSIIIIESENPEPKVEPKISNPSDEKPVPKVQDPSLAKPDAARDSRISRPGQNFDRNRSIEQQVAHKAMTERITSIEQFTTSLIKAIDVQGFDKNVILQALTTAIKEREYFNEEWKQQQLQLWEG